MSSKSKNNNMYSVDKTFCESQEYFAAMATTHRFMKDVLMNDENMIHEPSKNAMIAILSKYKEQPVLLYSILRLATVTAMNINIQYLDLKGNETNILNKLYMFLYEQLPNNISMLNTVYELYYIEIPPLSSSLSSSLPIKIPSNSTQQITLRPSKVSQKLVLKQRRQEGGNIKTF